MKAATFQRLQRSWRGTEEECRLAGKEIFEWIESERRPDWAANILSWAVERSRVSIAEIDEVLAVARDPARWPEAHDMHSALARAYRDAHKGDVVQAVLNIAVTTVKVTYNASGERAPFDHHAGWWMAERVRQFVDLCNDATEDEGWDLLVAPLRREPRSKSPFFSASSSD